MTPSIPPPALPGAPPTLADSTVGLAGLRQKRANFQSTIMTSPSGDTQPANTALKTVLGQ